MSEPIQSIAQNNYILATQQEVSHDNSLSGNGTVNSPLSVVPGYNETVLYSGPIGAFNTELTLNEPFSAFQYVGVTQQSTNTNVMLNYYPTERLDPLRICFNLNWGVNYMLNAYVKFTPVDNSNGLKYKYVNNTVQLMRHDNTNFSILQNDTTYVKSGLQIKFIGINRKAQ